MAALSQLAQLPQCYGENAVPYKTDFGFTQRTDWKQLFEFAKSQTQNGDYILLLSLQSPDKWIPRGVPGTNLYYNRDWSQHRAKITSIWQTSQGHWTPDFLESDLAKDRINKMLYVVIPKAGFLDPKLKNWLPAIENLPFKRTELSPSFLLFTIPISIDLSSSLKEFLDSTEKNLSHEAFLFPIYMLQLLLAREAKDSKMFLQYWHLLHNWAQYPQINDYLEKEWKQRPSGVN
jgi:hypothetical protein